jgi:hypothetical protein
MKQFTANRLAGGNRLFPAEIHIDNFGVNLKIPGLFSGKEKALSFDKISSVKIDAPMLGFSKITFDTIGWDQIVAEGFDKADAEEIKRLVQIGIQSVRHGNSGSSVAPSIDMSHVIAQSEATKAQAEVEKRKLDLEEAKHRQEVEEKDAARRKERADEYRKQGKNVLAFFVEMNPIYLIGIIVVVIFLGIAGYKKYEQHAAHAELREWVNNTINEPNNSNNQPNTSNTEPPIASSNPTDNVEKADTTVVENATPTTQQQSETDPNQQQQNETTTNSATVIADKSYFYDAADLNMKRKGYLVKGQKIAIIEEKGDFFSVTYSAENGMKTDAWMLKAEIQKD